MHDNQCPRRRRNQPEIDQMVRDFRTSGLSQPEFAHVKAAHTRLNFDSLVWAGAEEINRRKWHN
jgi:hypothetical protein